MAGGRRGTTLIELLVGIFLLGLLMTLVLSILVPAMRVTASASDQAELQRQVETALSRVALDVRQSVSGISQPGLLGLKRIETLGPDGTQVLESGIVLYVWDGKSLTRRFHPVVDALTSDALVRLARLPSASPRLLCTNAVAFDTGGTGPMDTPLTVHLTAALGDKRYEGVRTVVRRAAWHPPPPTVY